MRSEKGFSLPEMVVLLALVAMLTTVTITFALPWLAREDMRAAAYQVQMHLQIARIQAVNRNRSCRFQVDAVTSQVQVFDLNDPADGTDDIELANFTLPDTVSFADPLGGAPITLALLAGNTYQATFASDGSVSAGAGTIALSGGERFDRITLYGAGGVKTETWDGSSWVTGS